MSFLPYNLKPLPQNIALDAIQCLDCGWIGVSYYRHDYKTCKCPNKAMIDGGRAYLRAGAKDLSRIQQLCVSVPKEPSTRKSILGKGPRK